MSSFDRRALLAAGFGFAGTVAFGARANTRTATLVMGSAVLNEVPLDFNGFSVEKFQFSDSSTYRASNESLIALHKCLAPQGVLRIGGNTSEFCWWKAKPDAVEPALHAAGVGRSDNWMPQHQAGIIPEAVLNLRSFLDACDWTCIWGLNFGTGTPEANAVEAEFVAKALGPRLRYFQIGNEADLYTSKENRLRPDGWGYDDFLREWMATADAVSARVPNARFGGPDVAVTTEWISRFAVDAPKHLGQRLIGLSGHYYAEGPPWSPEATIANLLAEDKRVAAQMDTVMSAARSIKLPYRMTEGNSCFKGGKPKLSNTLAAALWGGDYAMYLASRGAKGINFHSGPGAFIANSLGDKLPGAQTEADRALAKLGAFYSPFAGSPELGYDARPLFYGMMLAQQFVGATLVANRFDPLGANATAYTAKTSRGLRAAIINKDASRDLNLDLRLDGNKSGMAQLWRLTGPELAATDGITLAGAMVAHGTAQWLPKTIERVAVNQGRARLYVPHGSAALLIAEA